MPCVSYSYRSAEKTDDFTAHQFRVWIVAVFYCCVVICFLFWINCISHCYCPYIARNPHNERKRIHLDRIDPVIIRHRIQLEMLLMIRKGF